MTPIGREYGSAAPFPSERIARLEADVEGNGEGLRRLEDLLAKQRESTEAIKKEFAAAQLANALVLGEIKGSLREIRGAARAMVWILSVGIPVVGIALAILGLVLRR